ncbi:Ig-like domain-containing protein [Methanobrevibacter sp.]
MNSNKLKFLIIAAIFLLSINFSFALDDNATQIFTEINDNQLTESEDNALSVEDSNDDLQQPLEQEIIGQENDDSKLSAEKVQTIKMQGITNRFDGVIWYKATFYDLNGYPIQNKVIHFSLNDDFEYGYEVITDSDGVGLLKAKFANGNYRLYAKNMWTGEVASDNIKVFDVITGAKDITMYYDDGLTYKVRVFDNNGNPAKAGQKVTFLVGNKKTIVKTDKNGHAKLKITSAPGLHTIHVIYNDFLVSKNLVVKSPFKVKLGKTNKNFKVKFTVKLLGKNKKKKLVKIKFNKKTYKSKTNKKGVAIFKLKHPKKTGSYKIYVQYKKYKDDYTFSTARY